MVEGSWLLSLRQRDFIRVRSDDTGWVVILQKGCNLWNADMKGSFDTRCSFSLCDRAVDERYYHVLAGGALP